jgi:hypothetical protein
VNLDDQWPCSTSVDLRFDWFGDETLPTVNLDLEDGFCMLFQEDLGVLGFCKFD